MQEVYDTTDNLKEWRQEEVGSGSWYRYKKAIIRGFKKKQFVGYIKKYIKNSMPNLDAEKQEVALKNTEGATKFLLSKFIDLQLFVDESMTNDVGMVFTHYKDGAIDPHFVNLHLDCRTSSVKK
ncbi:hypothetical protein HAX54_027462 [Datura stramonium]|uniref:TCTP domain-containing protein n=1 Tax=Datura stramonium TaxID=4076 RepID=A0ABS8S8T3_DATST|nr:hypothetical protein [Datura stramonium]